MLNCLMCVQPTDKAHKVIIKGTSVAVRGMGVLPLPLAPLDVGVEGQLHPSPVGLPGPSVSAEYFPCRDLFQGYLTASGAQLRTINTL